jgi:ketosteroid isomerase-like protein
MTAALRIFQVSPYARRAMSHRSFSRRARPLQSKMLRGTNLPHAKPRLNHAESLAVFKSMFEGHCRNSMSGEGAAASHDVVVDEQHHMRLDIVGTTAEGDRVAMEAESHVLNPVTRRLYNNFYHYLFRILDGQIVLFKEYQDTLHLLDFVSE